MAATDSQATATPTSDPAFLRKAYLIPGMVYPLWHLAAPRGATDPWIAWFAVSAVFFGVAAASRFVPAVRGKQRDLFPICSWAVTIHLFLLAQVNDMAPFYAVGSAITVLTAAMSIRTKPSLFAYGGFVLLLSTALFVLKPDARKLAYWGGMLTVVAYAYQRLSVQLAANAATQQQKVELERRVQERTAELSDANERLRQEMEERVRLEEGLRFSHKMEAMGRLAGGVAHEFNNLLTTIGIYAELALQSVPADGRGSEELGRIQKAQRQAASLTRRLLTFSRSSDSLPEVFDLNDLARQTIPMLRHLLGEGTRIEVDLEHEEYPIQADRGQIEQVLVNLALNARDAMPDGGVFRLSSRLVPRHSVDLRDLRNSSGACDMVCLRAEDDGVGMDAETSARAFDPFFTSKEVGEGTGLGLSIVYGIVKQAGGDVRLSSTPGHGACFELFWPRAKPDAESRVAKPSERPRGGREHILLVEDQKELRGALVRILRQSGYEVEAAEDADAALAAVRAADTPFDLVVTDMVMPRKSGLELAEELWALRPGARVLLVSGQASHHSLNERPLPDGVELLPKPFAPAELVETVRRTLDAPPPQRA